MRQNNIRPEWIQELFGHRLRFLRGLADMTQAELAERTLVTEEYVSKMERGLASPSFVIIGRLCAALKTDPANLFLFPCPTDSEREGTGSRLSRHSGHMGTWEVDLQTGKARWSKPLFRMLKKRPKVRGLTLETYLENVHPDDRAALTAVGDNPDELTSPRTLEYRLIRKDGSMLHVADHVEMHSATDGTPLLLRGLVVDVSEQIRLQNMLLTTNKRLEERIAEQTEHLTDNLERLKREVSERKNAESRHRHLFELSPVALWSEDHSKTQAHLEQLRQDGVTDLVAHFHAHPEEVRTLLSMTTIKDMNQAGLKLFRAPDIDALRSCLARFSTSDSIEAFQHHLCSEFDQSEFLPQETTFRTYDGQIVHCEVRSSRNTFSGDNETLVAATDITARVKAKEALRLSEAQLNEAQRLARVGSYSLDMISGHVDWSAQQYRNLGYEPFSIVPTAELFFSHVHPEDRDNCERVYRKALLEQADYENSFRIITAQGKVRHVHSRSRVVRDSSGIPSRIHGTTRDISESMQRRKGAASEDAPAQDMHETLGRAIQALSTLLEDGHPPQDGLREPLAELEQLLREVSDREGMSGDSPGNDDGMDPGD